MVYVREFFKKTDTHEVINLYFEMLDRNNAGIVVKFDQTIHHIYLLSLMQLIKLYCITTRTRQLLSAVKAEQERLKVQICC